MSTDKIKFKCPAPVFHGQRCDWNEGLCWTNLSAIQASFYIEKGKAFKGHQGFGRGLLSEASIRKHLLRAGLAQKKTKQRNVFLHCFPWTFCANKTRCPPSRIISIASKLIVSPWFTDLIKFYRNYFYSFFSRISQTFLRQRTIITKRLYIDQN